MRQSKLLRIYTAMWNHIVCCGGCGVSRYGSRKQRDTRCATGIALIEKFVSEPRRRACR